MMKQRLMTKSFSQQNPKKRPEARYAVGCGDVNNSNRNCSNCHSNRCARAWEIAQCLTRKESFKIGDFLFPEKSTKEQLVLKPNEIQQRMREYQLNNHYTRRERRIAHLLRIASPIIQYYRYKEVELVKLRAKYEAGGLGTDTRFYIENPLQVQIGYPARW